jgi:glutamate-5-semialdehyde dehydrogenase
VVTAAWTPRRQAMAHDQVNAAIGQARTSTALLRQLGADTRTAVLHRAADTLRDRSGDVLTANDIDIRAGREVGLSRSALDRLRLDDARIGRLADGLTRMAELPDPVGGVVHGGVAATSSREVVRVPLGVVGIVYEAQPSVVVQAAGPLLKAGNAAIFRGAAAAGNTDAVLVAVLRDALTAAGAPEDAVQLLPSSERSNTRFLVSARGILDLVVVRGGSRLVRLVQSDASVPVLELGSTHQHLYIDASADTARAERTVLDSVTRDLAAANPVHTVLVHVDRAADLLPVLGAALHRSRVEVRGDGRAVALVPGSLAAQDDDWHSEQFAPGIAVAVVDSIDQAISHINRFGTGHTEAIITEDQDAARRFTGHVDAAALRVNPLTPPDGEVRTTSSDGLFSTQKVHWRGVLAPETFTTTKEITWGP